MGGSLKKIHLCLVSDQPIPNLTTVVQLRPDTVVLLYTRDKKTQKDRLEQVMKGKGCAVVAREILPFGMGNVIAVCESIISEYAGCAVSLNITGGTKIAALAAFQVFYSANLPIYYVNTHGNEIVQVAPEECSIPLAVRIPIREYLAVYGFTVESVTTDTGAIVARRAVTDALRELAIRFERTIGVLNASFPENLENLPFPIDTKPLDEAIHELVPLLEKHGIASLTRDGGLHVATLEHANYLRGFWFEECVYLAAKAAGADEVALNVTGKWDVVGKHPPRNEFDVMIGKGNRLYFISCKTRNPNVKIGKEGFGKDFLYELDSLGDRALGLFGKKLLASARPVTDEYVKKRAQVMGIQIIDRNGLANLKEQIRGWLSC